MTLKLHKSLKSAKKRLFWYLVCNKRKEKNSFSILPRQTIRQTFIMCTKIILHVTSMILLVGMLSVLRGMSGPTMEFSIFFFNPSLNTFLIRFVTYKTCNMLNKLLCFVFWRQPLDKISSRHSLKIKCKQIFFLCKRNCVAFDQKSICTEMREATKCACSIWHYVASMREKMVWSKRKDRFSKKRMIQSNCFVVLKFANIHEYLFWRNVLSIVKLSILLKYCKHVFFVYK